MTFPTNSPPDGNIVAARSRIQGLTRAQYAVLLALADSRADKQIAGDLAVPEATIKAHLTPQAAPVAFDDGHDGRLQGDGRPAG